MKKLFLFLAMASTTMFVSCGSDDSDNTPTPPVVPPVEATALTITASATTVEVGLPVTLTVKNNLTPAVDVTSSSTFVITPATGATVTAGVFVATEDGVYTVVAKNGTLTSAIPVVIEATVPVPPFEGEGSVTVNGESFTTDFSILYYLGTTEGGVNNFIANSYSVDPTTDPTSYPNDVYVYFTSTQTDPEFIDLPLTGTYAFGDNATTMQVFDANIFIENDEILATGVTTNATWMLSSIVNSAEEATWAYTYEVTLADDSVATGTYTGDWEFANASQQGGRPAAKASAKVTEVKNVSKAQLKANLKAVLAKKAK